MLTKKFWKGAAERAIKTFVQTFIAALVASVGAVASAWDVAWGESLYAAGGVAVLAAFFSLATSLGNTDFVAGQTATDTTTATTSDEVAEPAIDTEEDADTVLAALDELTSATTQGSAPVGDGDTGEAATV